MVVVCCPHCESTNMEYDGWKYIKCNECGESTYVKDDILEFENRK